MQTRRFSKISIVLLGAFLILALGGGIETSQAKDPQSDFHDFSELDLDALLNQTVVTASKHEQKISDLPVSVSVITAEQIEASGARNIPELLFGIPGIEVIINSASHIDISARGMNNLRSNNMLVMVDGRSVYADFYGMTLWEFLPVALEEIKSIEVIKGPGSAIYGANAFAGVINIITYQPDEIDTAITNVKASHVGEEQSSFVYGDTHGDLGWKVSGGWETTQNWETDYNEEEMTRINFDASYQLSNESILSVFTGNANGVMKISTGPTLIDLDGQYHHTGAAFKWKNASLRYFWTQWHLDGNFWSFNPISDNGTMDNGVHDIEFQHSFPIGSSHFVLWGGNFRHKTVEWTLMQDAKEQDLYSAFLYDEWHLRNNLLLSLGIRYDEHPLVGDHLVPRGGVVFQPHEKHALRLTYGEAYRDPSFLESYGYAELELAPGIDIVIHGDENLKSEEIRSLELGYQGLITKDILGSLALYHNRVREIIEINTATYFPSPPFPAETPSEVTFLNVGSWDITGAECNLGAHITDWLRLRLGYSYVWAEGKDTGAWKGDNPCHSAMGEIIVTPHAYHSVSLFGRYQTKTDWILYSFDNAKTKGIGTERFILNARWRVKPLGNRTQVVIGIDNVLDRRFRDHPETIEQRRKVFTSLAVEF